MSYRSFVGTVARKVAPRALVLALAAQLGACSLMSPSRDNELPRPHIDRVAQAGTPTDGAIYTEGQDMSYFADLKARRVGDIVTIRLVETTAASKSATTSTSKDSTTTITPPTIAGRAVTVNGTPVLDTSMEGSREFSGQGSSNQSNSLEGSITVTVVDRLPNGNLVIEGEKWLTLNQGDEVVRIAGVIRPYDILPDNSVTSDKVAEARIRYSGRGQLANANRAGWLSRFFNSPLWPY